MAFKLNIKATCGIIRLFINIEFSFSSTGRILPESDNSSFNHLFQDRITLNEGREKSRWKQAKLSLSETAEEKADISDLMIKKINSGKLNW